ncbi:hypothetical protein [Microbacterium suaedae]|uniref:hypothetical protein n=1 Tax=Microbacterium suaedae TaxID=2067813 RepID=UPI000DA1645F|nr:hypothetical protein [Microbacterium suaedae]
MILSAHSVAKGPLPATSLEVATGGVTLVPVEGGQRPTLLALILAGRMTPAAGDVTLDGASDARQLRRRVAIVDAPDTSAPVDDLPLASVVTEEFVFSGLRGPRRAARRLLADEGLSDHASTPIGDLPAAARIRVLTRTAAAPPSVDALVLTAPDRHGGDTADWLDAAHAWAARRYAVIVLASAGAIAAARA